MTATKVTVCRNTGDAHATVCIEAPDGVGIVFDPGMLQQGILMLGEFGPSGVKIAAFKDWDEAWFDAENHGYKISAK